VFHYTAACRSGFVREQPSQLPPGWVTFRADARGGQSDRRVKTYSGSGELGYSRPGGLRNAAAGVALRSQVGKVVESRGSACTGRHPDNYMTVMRVRVGTGCQPVPHQRPVNRSSGHAPTTGTGKLPVPTARPRASMIGRNSVQLAWAPRRVFVSAFALSLDLASETDPFEDPLTVRAGAPGG